MSSLLKTFVTPEEYLERERIAETKSEYFNGEIFAMAGATREHNLVCGNMFREINSQLRGKPCESYSNDMRVLVPATGLYTYPDIVVVCDEPHFEDDVFDVLLNSTVIVEVLSKSTASYDRGDKFMHYRTIESMREYVIVAQKERKIEHHVKQPDGRWLLTDIRDQDLKLTSIGCTLTMDEIYERVEFDE